MTPLSQGARLPSPVEPTLTSQHPGQQKPPLSGEGGSDVPMVSPSELNTSVFKSPSPSQLSESKNHGGTDAGKSHSTTQQGHDSSKEMLVSGSKLVEGTRVDTRASEPETGSDVSNLLPVDEGTSDNKKTRSDPQVEVETTAAGNNSVPIEKQDAGDTQNRVDGKSALPVSTKQQSSLLIYSPRLSLSLRKCKVNSVGSRRSLSMNNEQSKEKEDQLETSNQFVLGVEAGEGEQDSSVESQFQLPAIEVPSDSQFELSGDSQTLFQIQRPTATEPPAQPPVSSSQKQAEKRQNPPPPSSLFAFVDPNLSSRQAIKKAKENNPSQNSPPALQFTSSQGDNDDPYVYDSQNENMEVDFLVQKRAKRTSSGKERPGETTSEKTPDVTRDGCLVVDDATRQGGSVKESARADGVSRTDLESTAAGIVTKERLVDRAALQTESSEGKAGDGPTGNPNDQEGDTPVGSQPTSNVTNGSQMSQSLFTSPSFLPSTSTAAPFASPSAVVPSSLIGELERQAGMNRAGTYKYQLKLMKVVRTVVEERQVYSEIIKDGRVVQGSERTWTVSYM